MMKKNFNVFSADFARVWVPWIISWLGWACMIFNGGVLGQNQTQWRFVFTIALITSIVAGLTKKRTIMTLLIAVVLTISIFRTWQYAKDGTWSPFGVWLIVLGAHLTWWASVPVKFVTDLECQRAQTCPRRVIVGARHEKGW